jgi:hypothetical protein
MSISLDNLPPAVEQALLARAAAERKSPEAVVVEVLSSGLKATTEHGGNGSMESDPRLEGVEFELALREQRLIDWETWSDGVKRRDLSGIAGRRLITPEMKAVFREQRRIDPELWK